MRRECLDYVIPLSERRLRRTIKIWVTHYNLSRPHSAIGPDIQPRVTKQSANVAHRSVLQRSEATPGILARANTQLCLSYRIHLSLRHSLSHVSGREDDTNRIIRRQVRSHTQAQFDSLNYAAMLWSVFRSLVAGNLKSMRKQLNCTVGDVMVKIDERVSRFLVQALQMDAFTMQLEHELTA